MCAIPKLCPVAMLLFSCEYRPSLTLHVALSHWPDNIQVCWTDLSGYQGQGSGISIMAFVFMLLLPSNYFLLVH